jgi:LuxR family quorum sensing-dependent transcriptional regulator
VPSISTTAIDLIDTPIRQASAAAVGRAFFESLRPFGVRAIYARAYRQPRSELGEEEHIFSRISPAGWEGFYAENRFQDVNYLPREVRRRASAFKWSDIQLFEAREKALARALVDNGFEDGIATPCHGPAGYVGVVSLAFERLSDVAPADRGAIEMASLVLHNRMRDCSGQVQVAMPRLTPRERDCLGFVAEGKSDWDISVMLGVSHTTIISHVQNAKRKLGAATRAQAVAQCYILRLL